MMRGYFSLLILSGLGYIAYAFHRRSNPKKPILELSAGGILCRIGGDKEFHIPWKEVHGLGLIDIKGPRGSVFRDVAVALVSQDFYDANVPIKSWWARGPAWRYQFIPKEGSVQIAFHHELMSVPADKLWEEIGTRWRVLSGHPNATLLAAPRIIRARGWIGGWTPSPALKRAVLAIVAALAVPAIYSGKCPPRGCRSPTSPKIPAPTILHNLLDGAGVHARVAGKGIVILRRGDVSEVGATRCAREIARDPARDGLTPAYVVAAFCTADLTHVSGLPAQAIFKLISQTSTSEDWEGKPTEYKAIVPAEIDADEAQAKLCELGSCPPV